MVWGWGFGGGGEDDLDPGTAHTHQRAPTHRVERAVHLWVVPGSINVPNRGQTVAFADRSFYVRGTNSTVDLFSWY